MAEIYGNTTATPINPDLFGGGETTVDQTYNPESENAQSGIAVAQALSNYHTAEVVDGKIGDIETALDNIIAIQETLIGGGNV